MNFTRNSTTVEIGDSIATIIADSVSPHTKRRITTIELVYPRIIHSELMTHRVFSRNAASSRATPVTTFIKEVEEQPFMPAQWLQNKAGMAGGEPLADDDASLATMAVEQLRQQALRTVSNLQRLGVSKQQANRYLEPFLRIRTLVTATEWKNFFKLRLDKKTVQPEMFDLATAMKAAMEKSTPVRHRNHLPYIETTAEIDDRPDDDADLRHLQMISAARCARVSYLTHAGRKPDALDDIELAVKLLKSRHMSPFEHPATACHLDVEIANFRGGWGSFRADLEVQGSPLRKQLLEELT